MFPRHSREWISLAHVKVQRWELMHFLSPSNTFTGVPRGETGTAGRIRARKKSLVADRRRVSATGKPETAGAVSSGKRRGGRDEIRRGRRHIAFESTVASRHVFLKLSRNKRATLRSRSGDEFPFPPHPTLHSFPTIRISRCFLVNNARNYPLSFYFTSTHA